MDRSAVADAKLLFPATDAVDDVLCGRDARLMLDAALPKQLQVCFWGARLALLSICVVHVRPRPSTFLYFRAAGSSRLTRGHTVLRLQSFGAVRNM